MKKKVNLSLDEDTVMKLKELADKAHKPVSQWVSDKVWEKDEAISEKEVMKGGQR